MFRVFTTEEFDNKFSKLDVSEKKKISKIIDQLKEKGDSVGKPLGRNYFREKKFGGKRLYFLVYKEFMVVLGIAISNKKTQQETIDKIISRLEDYKKIVLEVLSKN